jgi:hypothetical protein
VLRYEDNVEDEWFVVWLLLQLTAQLPGVSARCWDDDGEFLLIEVRQRAEPVLGRGSFLQQHRTGVSVRARRAPAAQRQMGPLSRSPAVTPLLSSDRQLPNQPTNRLRMRCRAG